MTEGRIVEGRITYKEGNFLLTFSYTSNGQRFHKSWAETLDRNSKAKLRAATARYKVGDIVPVWCADADPNVCCIGNRVTPIDLIKGWAARYTDMIARLFR
jgi:hypothetical protein